MGSLDQLIATQYQRNAPPSPIQMLAAKQDAQQNQLAMEDQRQLMDQRAQSFEMDKGQEGLRFAANVGQQLSRIDDPLKKQQLYATALQIAQKNGHDVSEFPREYNDQAQMMLDVAYEQVYAPDKFKSFADAVGIYNPGDYTPESWAQFVKSRGKNPEVLKRYKSQSVGAPTSDAKNLETYNQLLAEGNTEQAEMFGRAANLLSDEGQKLTSYMEKRLGEANDEFVSSDAAARNYEGLAQDFMSTDMAGGAAATWSERYKAITGQEDAVTEFRREYRQIRNSEAVKNLPPGVASDKDIELALSGFPPDTANPEYIASFMQGMAKLARARADYADFKAEYISKKGTERGFLDAWKSKVSEAPRETGPVSVTTPDGQVFTFPDQQSADNFRKAAGF